MLRSFSEEEYRNHHFIWILIESFFPGSIDASNFHQVAKCYMRILKRLGVELIMYEDIVSHTYRDVDDAIFQAIMYRILNLPNAGSTRLQVVGNVNMFIRRFNDLTTQEIKTARRAAKISHRRLLWGNLNQTVEKVRSKAAAS